MLKDKENGKMDVHGGKKSQNLGICHLWIYQCPSFCMT